MHYGRYFAAFTTPRIRFPSPPYWHEWAALHLPLAHHFVVFSSSEPSDAMSSFAAEVNRWPLIFAFHFDRIAESTSSAELRTLTPRTSPLRRIMGTASKTEVPLGMRTSRVASSSCSAARVALAAFIFVLARCSISVTFSRVVFNLLATSA